MQRSAVRPLLIAILALTPLVLSGCGTFGNASNVPPGDAGVQAVSFRLCASEVPRPVEGEYACDDLETTYTQSSAD